MNRREQIDKRRSDIIKIVWLLAVTAIIVVFAAFAFSHIMSASKIKAVISDYPSKLIINNSDVRAYKIADGGPYIVLEELPNAGLNVEFIDDELISISSVAVSDRNYVLETELTGKTAEPVNQNYYINAEKKGTLSKKYHDKNKVIKQMYSAEDMHIVNINDLRKCGIIEPSKNRSKSDMTFQTSESLLPKTQLADSSVRDDGSRRIEKPLDGKKVDKSKNSAIAETNYSGSKPVIFLDPGHGVSSDTMSDEDKRHGGWVQNSNGRWGEWRHWRNGQFEADCEGDDGNADLEGDCWYPIENGDRSTEPEINMKNSEAAKKSLEQLGYKVVLSRSSNENPSITKRIRDAQSAGAELYICIHSNAGGGSGTAYISLSESNGYYIQSSVSDYARKSNILGKTINDKIVSNTTLSEHGGGCIDGEPYLVLFQKSPMITAYLEIGFFDNSSDLSILNSRTEAIGSAIAEGIDEYCKTYMTQ